MKRQSTRTVALSGADKTVMRTSPTKTKTAAKPKDENGISALSRGIRVLRAFRVGDSVLSNSELAKRTNLPRPTISRITATLTELGCLAYFEELEAYKLGSAAIAIGHVASSNFDLLQLARPLMQKLAEETGLTVAIGTLETNRMVYTEFCQGPALIGLQLRVGSRVPLFTTAMGLAYLAMIPADRRASLVEKYGSHDAEERERNERAIERASADLGKRGFCGVVGEWFPDMNAVGVPLRTIEGNFVIDCAGPAYMLPSSRMFDEIGPQLASIATKITENMGYHHP